jgi:hypothetical protein
LMDVAAAKHLSPPLPPRPSQKRLLPPLHLRLPTDTTSEHIENAP